MTVPLKLYIIARSVIVVEQAERNQRIINHAFLFWSMIIQATIRTSSDVQNGISTQIISKFEIRMGNVASRYETGYASIRQAMVTIKLTNSVRYHRQIVNFTGCRLPSMTFLSKS